ncbi:MULTISPECIES: CRISPR-associated endoribonuclease Cas6 [unclassified Frankia]|uniref:CRISPR-associated endoribonuclease Cas6 n=1 Tax=unclassified Frankia TaxID=2632575 RepID=UPI001EF5D7CB|nr:MULTISPECIES: CRISPR-associated endoribonuclease Cas6 [unclassified Frankia]
MRFRVDVAADVDSIPWDQVFSPARGVAYDLIRAQDEALAAELHDHGYAGSSLRPLGLSAPRFRGAGRRTGVYGASGDGTVWFGSPVPRVAAALLAGVAGRTELRWGTVALRVRGVQLEPMPDHSRGWADFSTVTEVLVKFEDRFIHPDHPRYAERLCHNLRHKADLLGLPGDLEIDIVSYGPARKFLVQRAPRYGSTVQLRVHADPVLLDALYEWGLGLNTNQGFGWIR